MTGDSDYYYEREQSEVKHRILERYLQAFAPIIGTAYEEIVYVDCFAGPWQSRDDALTDTSFHIAVSVFQECLRRFRCKSVRMLLIEKDPDTYQKLRRYADSVKGISVRAENWDFTEHIADIVDFCKSSGKSGFAFVFLDPTGWTQICTDLIRPLLQLEPGEVLINFMSFWVKRFLDDESKSFEELLGRDEVERIRRLQGDEQEDELISVYAKRMKQAGEYNFTCAIPILMPDRDAIHYHLVFGTRSAKGLEEFKKTEADAIPFMHQRRAAAQRRRAEESDAQGFLLGPLDTYKEDRFRRFHELRINNARAAVLSVLCKGDAFYYELYRESMQYSTVVEDDLRAWLSDWLQRGDIVYLNWEPRQRALRPETKIRLKRTGGPA